MIPGCLWMLLWGEYASSFHSLIDPQNWASLPLFLFIFPILCFHIILSLFLLFWPILAFMPPISTLIFFFGVLANMCYNFSWYVNNFSSAKLVGTSHCMAVRLRHLALSRTTSFFIYRLPIQETAFFIYRLPFQRTACCFLGQFYRLWHLALIRTRIFFYWHISIPRDAICFLGQFYSHSLCVVIFIIFIAWIKNVFSSLSTSI